MYHNHHFLPAHPNGTWPIPHGFFQVEHIKVNHEEPTASWYASREDFFGLNLPEKHFMFDGEMLTFRQRVPGDHMKHFYAERLRLPQIKYHSFEFPNNQQ